MNDEAIYLSERAEKAERELAALRSEVARLTAAITNAGMHVLESGIGEYVLVAPSPLTAERGEDSARLTADADRWCYVRRNSQWIRRHDDDGVERTYIEVRVADGADLSCAPMMDHAIDVCRAALSETPT